MAAKGHYGPGGGTKQGIYVCTPGGQFLGSINSLSADAVKQMMNRSLAAWQALPAADRLAKMPETPKSKPKHRWEWSAPDRGLILKETIRYLKEGSPTEQTPDKRFNHDFAWFSADEAKSLIPDSPVVGETKQVPEEFYRRLARCHLLNTAHGEGGTYHADQVRGKVSITILEVSPKQVRIKLSGNGVSTGTQEKAFGLAPAAKIRTELLGFANYDRTTEQFSQFELIALGKIYRSTEAAVTAPADQNIGWLFTLADRERPFDRLAPTHLHAYDASWVDQPDLRLHDYQPNRPNQK